ncbi:MAG TPA: helix-turn-helix domain-containing protein [Patescibacteria group bacterium]|nr:helix-turn-helix domain-containing protein [Patescibacteria group bacterium]
MKLDKKLQDLLGTLDLTRSEALTYTALLQIESVSIRKVAAFTGINRGTTYEALKHLVTLGLASVKTRGEREYYTAESPERIYDLIRDKRRDLLDASTAAKALVPHLLSQHARPEGRPVVRYYEGDDGVVAILKDVLETCRVLKNPYYYCYSSSRIRQYLYRKFPQFTDRRVANNISVKVIAVGEGGDMASQAERKWLPGPGSADASSYTLIYGDKVAIISISNDFTPYGVVIEEKGTANMQRLVFDQLWSFL